MSKSVRAAGLSSNGSSNARQISSNLVKSRQMLVNFCHGFPGPSVKFRQRRQRVKSSRISGPLGDPEAPQATRPRRTMRICDFRPSPGAGSAGRLLSMSRTEGGISLMGDPPNDGVFRQITAARRALCQIPSKPVKTWTPPGPSVK